MSRCLILWTKVNHLYFPTWIPVIIILLLSASFRSNSQPIEEVKQGSSVNLGPCTWIIERACPDKDIKFFLYTRRNLNDRQLIYIDDTWDKSNLSTSFFNPYHPSKIIIHGYNSDMFLTPLIDMKDEYLQRSEYNLFYVDWAILAPSPCYITAVHNIHHVGTCIAQLIRRILEAGTANIHIVGFSLGAQVANHVANNLKPFKLPRITGLDPALPLFVGVDDEEKLDESDAEFVDVIHTNAFVQGKIEQCGHVDFYMNGGILQPGCWSSGQNPIACSHHRSPAYFTESIRSLQGFWGWPCSSYINFLLGFCPPNNNMILAGEDCRTTSRGMHLVNTNDSPPFAIGKWIDLSMTGSKTSPHNNLKPFKRRNPLQEEIDQWGKLDGDFNNIMHFPTPFPQDPNGLDWPYFSHFDSNEITNRFIKKKTQQQLEQQFQHYQQQQQYDHQQIHKPPISTNDLNEDEFEIIDTLRKNPSLLNKFKYQIDILTSEQPDTQKTVTTVSSTAYREHQYVLYNNRQNVTRPDIFTLPTFVNDKT